MLLLGHLQILYPQPEPQGFMTQLLANFPFNPKRWKFQLIVLIDNA